MPAKQSAGLLLYRHGSGGTEVLLVHPGGPFWARKDHGAWSIPKGEVEPGEEALDVALREFEEELGTPAPVVRDALVDLGTIRQKAGKIVAAWCGEGDFDPSMVASNTFSIEWPPRSGRLKEFPEVDRAGWFSLVDARVRLLEAQAELIDRLEAALEVG
jgi:predicted NUDIX family NTP pyrophosphohydrolase